MTDSSLVEIMEALAGQIQDTLVGTADPLIDGLQVYPFLLVNPTPPAIDIYPGDPFQEGIAFGRANNNMFFNVRARVNTPDHEGAQELLLSMMDPRETTSVALALTDDKTLGGKVEHVSVAGPSDYGVFVDPGGAGAWLGCTWRVEVLP